LRTLMHVIAVLRWEPASRHRIGYADIDVWFELAKKGYVVHVVLQGRSNTRKILNGLHMWEVGLPGIPILSTFIYWVLSFFKLLEIRPDVVVVYYMSFPVGIMYKILRSCVLILDIRSIPVMSRIRLQRALLKTVLLSGFIDGITIITKEMMLQIIRDYKVYPKVPIAVWPSGFNPRYFNEKVKGEHIRARYGLGRRFILLYHGTIAKERGLENLIHALKILVDKGIRSVGLWIIGSDKDKEVLKHLTTQLGLQEYILFFDPASYPEIAQYIAAADACIVPLPYHPWWLYQFPLKVVECLAVGKPVIATDIPCHKQIKGGILLIQGDSPQAIADTIKKFISLPEAELERLRKEALVTAKNYSWEKHANITEKFLKQLIKIKITQKKAKRGAEHLCAR